MSRRQTELYEPYEEQPYDRDDADLRVTEPRILWGRVTALVLVVALAFYVGHLSAPSGIPPERLDAVQRKLSSSDRELDRLRAQLVDAEQQLQIALATAAEASPEDAPEPAPGPKGKASTYVVKRNDTLAGIAQRLYGDLQLADCIAAANGIKNAKHLVVGAKLKIPAKHTC